jgi:arsenate reductase
MAEAFLRRYAGDIFEVHSAGLEPKGVNPLTVKVMDEVGIDISEQTSKGIEAYFGKTDIYTLITVCDDADQNCPSGWPGIHTRLHWSFEDPAKFQGSEEEKLAKFREVRDQIEERIRQWVVEQYIFADY